MATQVLTVQEEAFVHGAPRSTPSLICVVLVLSAALDQLKRRFPLLTFKIDSSDWLWRLGQSLPRLRARNRKSM
jgi:hypothetical protein